MTLNYKVVMKDKRMSSYKTLGTGRIAINKYYLPLSHWLDLLHKPMPVPVADKGNDVFMIVLNLSGIFSELVS